MLLIIDANVLIAYLEAEPSILSLTAQHLGQVFVPHYILDEVGQLTEADCQDLGLQLVEETTEQLERAGVEGGPLSAADKVCLYLAQEHAWTCVTNDMPLRRACEAVGVDTLWGLELMLHLVQRKRLRASKAIKVAKKIQAASGGRIREEMMVEFRRRAGKKGWSAV